MFRFFASAVAVSTNLVGARARRESSSNKDCSENRIFETSPPYHARPVSLSRLHLTKLPLRSLLAPWVWQPSVSLQIARTSRSAALRDKAPSRIS
jgi:hypothetical protein